MDCNHIIGQNMNMPILPMKRPMNMENENLPVAKEGRLCLIERMLHFNQQQFNKFVEKIDQKLDSIEEDIKENLFLIEDEIFKLKKELVGKQL